MSISVERALFAVLTLLFAKLMLCPSVLPLILFEDLVGIPTAVDNYKRKLRVDGVKTPLASSWEWTATILFWRCKKRNRCTHYHDGGCGKIGGISRYLLCRRSLK